jgi:multiple sugar transport system permease protein
MMKGDSGSGWAQRRPQRFAGWRGWLWLGALGLATLVVLPLLWGIMTSFKTEVTAVAYPPRLWPRPFTWRNYAAVFGHQTFLAELANSILYSVGGVGLAILVGGPAGYAASRFRFAGKQGVLLLIMGTSMVPGVALLVPTYYLLDRAGLVNSALAIIVISAARLAPQTVWFMQNFIDGVPADIEEAALVDGANRRQMILRVLVPLIKPGLAATFILGMITVWNDYITVAVFAPDIGRRTLQVALVNQVFDAIGISWSYLVAFAVVASVPVILVFLAAQKWFVSGLTAGSLKG